ncbi:MAG: type II toxin-antitoxin system HicA family toxin [Bacteroidota bacterium]|nr:type II toxin-antitoxin system HicA family toxin [Bacteroidota bacterium]
MKTLSGKEFAKLLEKQGWILKRINGSHFIYSHPDKIEIISVPVHKNDDLKRIAKKANEYCRYKRF